MTSTKSTTRTGLAGLLALATMLPAALVLYGCTDLDEETFGAVTAENFYDTDEEIIAALAPVYAQLRSNLGNYHDLSQVSSDESVVPTRGSDWFDGGVWLDMHRHTWTPTLDRLNNAWVDAYTGVARANVLLETLLEGDAAGREGVVAELRVLRAFYYYELMDLFGGVPIVGDDEYTVDPENPPPRATRAEVFDFIESELLAARQDLPATWGSAGYGRVSQGTVDALLANMYLNAEVFTGDASGACPAPGQARWQDAVDVADRVLNAGDYSLNEDWFANFSPDNHDNPEAMMVIAYLPEDGLGMTFPHQALHYNQLSPSPWNGFSTLAETYDTFSDDDLRKDIFLAGPQVNVETGEPVNNRQGEPLVFSPDFEDITDATEGEGVRIYKWPVDPDHFEANQGNDYALFRLAEIYLIKAEALNELGQTADALQMLDPIRDRAGLAPLRGLTQEQAREAILDERLFEFTYEGKRRQDLVRFGRFTDAWAFKEAGPCHLTLFPVPQIQRDANPNLTQNPGY